MKTEVLKIIIADLRWDFFRGSGKGGQKRNKTDNCARCTHEASQATGKAEDGRSKEQNKKRALERLISTKLFREWAEAQVSQRLGNKRNISISLKEKSIVIYDEGQYFDPKRKEVKRLPVQKDKNQDERRKVKKLLKKFIE